MYADAYILPNFEFSQIIREILFNTRHAAGFTGSTGNTGFTGATGFTGFTGFTGDTGAGYKNSIPFDPIASCQYPFLGRTA